MVLLLTHIKHIVLLQNTKQFTTTKTAGKIKKLKFSQSFQCNQCGMIYKQKKRLDSHSCDGKKKQTETAKTLLALSGLSDL